MPKPSKPTGRPLKDEGGESPVRQHHRLALGEKMSTSDPNGGHVASTENRVSNSQGKTH